MTSANVALMHRKLSDPQRTVDADLRHIQDLLFVRELLERRGATPAELRECDLVIAAARSRLADDARRASAALAA